MKRSLIGLSMLLTMSSAFADSVGLTPAIVEELTRSGTLDSVRLTLDQPLSVTYELNKSSQKELVDDGLKTTTTTNLKVRKISTKAKGKIIAVVEDEKFEVKNFSLRHLEFNYPIEYRSVVYVSFDSCNSKECAYKFAAPDENTKGAYILKSAPSINGLKMVSANSGILPFTDAFKAIDRVNLMINKEDINIVNKDSEDLSGYTAPKKIEEVKTEEKKEEVNSYVD